MTEFTPLDLERFQGLLQTQSLGRHIHHETECTSTNDIAKRMMHEGAESGTIVVAESQSAGRGRFMRAWTSDPGQNLLWSIILRWPRKSFSPVWLTVATGLAVRDTISKLFKLTCGLKWPNDIVVRSDGVVQKLAGVLTEATTLTPNEQGAVVGVGLNVNQVWTPDKQEPGRHRTSLAMALGQEAQREPILAGVLTTLEDRLHMLLMKGQGEIVEEARRHLVGVGETVIVQVPGRHWEGTLAGIDDGYQLLLKDDQGQLQKAPAGEVLFGGRREG